MNNTNIRFILMLLSSGPLLWVLSEGNDQRGRELERIINKSYSKSRDRLLPEALMRDPEITTIFPADILEEIQQNHEIYNDFKDSLNSYLVWYSVFSVKPTLKPYVESFISEFLLENAGKPLENVNYCDEFVTFFMEKPERSEELMNLLGKIEDDEGFDWALDRALSARVYLALRFEKTSPKMRSFYAKLYNEIDDGRFSSIILKYHKWSESAVVEMADLFIDFQIFFRDLYELQ
ncbi:uncharacterized protein LOC120354004 isoform X4 [Nilaparvata lugens]|uniref:uncharacterized protein LOC120354004 isoform X4 n=1 Tax=Nilaparvata lugens TaxID=108931 RepID=UPI00193E5FF7|nr:uncharacterized protein LOC120354004 isoform X4 [Nilaparvata lugens]